MDQDLNQLLEKAKEAIRRDINHIFQEVSTKKLSPTSARDLVAYVKFLGDALGDAEDGAAKLSEAELKALAQAYLNETKSDPSNNGAAEAQSVSIPTSRLPIR